MHRLPHVCERPKPEGATSGRYWQAVQAGRTGRVDIETERQDRSGIRHLPVRTRKRQDGDRFRRQRKRRRRHPARSQRPVKNDSARRHRRTREAKVVDDAQRSG